MGSSLWIWSPRVCTHGMSYVLRKESVTAVAHQHIPLAIAPSIQICSQLRPMASVLAIVTLRMIPSA